MFYNDNPKYALTDENESVQHLKETTICSYLMCRRDQYDKFMLEEVLESSQDSPLYLISWLISVEVRC